MSDMLHSPKPWWIRPEAGIGTATLVRDAEGDFVALCDSKNKTPAMNYANGKLISVAPEMFEVLENTLVTLRKLKGMKAAVAANEIEAVLKKVRG